MSTNTKENPLLFSANISSPFDDINTSALLIPPRVETQKISDSSETTLKSQDDKSNGITQSLQPHLEKSRTPSPKITPVPSPSPASISTPVLSSQATASTFPLQPPIKDIKSGPILRKPTNKYVVPPEISGTTSSQAPFSYPPRLPPFLPQQTSPSPISTFTPLPNYDSQPVTMNDNLLPSFKGSSITHFPSADFSATTSQSQSQLTQSTVIPASFDAMAESPPVLGDNYHPVIPHWFYADGKPVIWKPFSFTDSLNLEEAFLQGSPEKVPTDGGRYDVDIKERTRLPVYWEGIGTSVRRCSWFRKSYSEMYPVPYTEEVAEKLEAEYKDAMLSDRWHRQVELPAGERVMLNSQHSMHHYHLQEPTDSPNISSVSESQYPQTVKRGSDDFEIKEGAPDTVDHLLFLIHGIGPVCDFSFRTVEQCVDDFRAMGEDLLSTHFRKSIDSGQVGRVEILPISWHKALHGDATGLDEKLKFITLRSIPKFREFTNDTLLDVLFYTSPVYCQHIMDTVASEMERLLTLFRERHPSFGGGISVGGHSLGSVILFDLLMHQKPTTTEENTSTSEEVKEKVMASTGEEVNSLGSDMKSSLTSQVNFEIGVAGTGQPAIIYPQLSFHPQAFFLMGSPVAMFITVRGIDTLGPSFKLPTCDHVFNIFHPFDPVAYRLEALIDPSLIELRPVMIPHHKGRKRMHLELKDTIERVGADIKNKIVDSIQSTWNRFCQIYGGSQSDSMRAEVGKALEERLEVVNEESEAEVLESYEMVGQLNRGLRVDYVLQEKPYESLTEYIFALQAHVSYWNSEDTLLMILKELYKLNGISSDAQPVHQPRRSSKPDNSGYDQTFSDTSTTQDLPPPYASSPPPPTMPVPMFSSPTTQVTPIPSGPPVVKSDTPRTLRGRPVFDPLNTPVTTMGMDPTAAPSGGGELPMPPILPNMKFNRKKT